MIYRENNLKPQAHLFYQYRVYHKVYYITPFMTFFNTVYVKYCAFKFFDKLLLSRLLICYQLTYFETD